jgi:hypothetical protein
MACTDTSYPLQYRVAQVVKCYIFHMLGLPAIVSLFLYFCVFDETLRKPFSTVHTKMFQYDYKSSFNASTDGTA